MFDSASWLFYVRWFMFYFIFSDACLFIGLLTKRFSMANRVVLYTSIRLLLRIINICVCSGIIISFPCICLYFVMSKEVGCFCLLNQRTACKCWFLPSTVWIPCLGCNSSGLVASIFSERAKIGLDFMMFCYCYCFYVCPLLQHLKLNIIM